jgi:hypothetical protein
MSCCYGYQQREPLQERGNVTSTEGTQSQAPFYYGKSPVVERHYRIRLHAINQFFSYSAMGDKYVRRRVAQSGNYSAEIPEQLSIDEAEQEDAYASLN